jgi:serine/threonine-protein kinase
MKLQATAPEEAKRAKGQIGKYRILGHIATGGMGAIYRAEDTELGRQVALKVLAPELAAKPIALKRFRREARSAARLRHRNIVAIYDVGEDNGLHFLALEFIDGIDLLEYIARKGKLEPQEARQILIQAAKALEHTHKQGIVHRDIKPSNFLIANKNGKQRIKLTDMGLARLVREKDMRLTEAGSTLGTVDYMSPEQARDGNSADIRSDIYSLGCTFYHMLTGAAPFAQGTMAERILQHFETKAPDVRELNARVPEGLAVVLAKMLEKNPADRYQTPGELLRDLENPERVGVRFNPNERRAVLAGLAHGEESAPVEPAASRRVRPRNNRMNKTWTFSSNRTIVGLDDNRRFRVAEEPASRSKSLPEPIRRLLRFLRRNWLRLASSAGFGLAVALILIQLCAQR